MSPQSHNAVASALGYLYQSQWPLLALIRGADERPDLGVTIELHDDVAWEASGTATELLQLKHHLRRAGGLGDKDVDIWRTIRAWMDTQDVADPNGPTLTIVTTQTAATGSAAAALRSEDDTRNVPEAIRLLEAAARESTAEVSRDTRSSFLSLPASTREVFVGRMYVLDQAPKIGDLDSQVRRELRWVLPRGHETTFMSLVWGWWHAMVLGMLQGHRRMVTALDVSAAVDAFRDQFGEGTLPTLVPIEAFDPAHAADYVDRCFVQQLGWVGTPATHIQKAILDYYRAFTQSARWVEDDLVGMDELESFEKNLRDEWEREFAWMIGDLPVDADDEAKRRAGQALLRKLLDQSRIRVRERYDQVFFSRGKHHELADGGRIGWHPDFAARLEQLLTAAAS